MVRRVTSCMAAALLLVLTVPGSTPSFAQQVQQAAPMSQEDGMRIVNEVRKQLSSLSDYSVFDWITFGFRGRTLVLNGYASRPILKDDAERAVKKIPGIDGVDNQIKVLPLSPNDDRIRAAVYNRIYTQSALRKYNANQGSLAQALGPGGRSFAMMSGGITNDPPIGYHAIHIIVNNGHVTLYGVVLNKTDADIAMMQANSAPGAFSVDNELVVEGTNPGQEPK
ncbi:BON domain-containing protein [Edaphobacter sp. HDX4]|uniref:BON domain-containing protein n=1 Tax=Edaphobacter sp. HDX4 TaxID=2794064 RepID=UPI002FE54F07